MNDSTSNEPAEPQLTAVDLVFFKDVADMVKARNIFFMPFFGAFLAFMVAKSQYIIDSNVVIQVVVGGTFLMGLL